MELILLEKVAQLGDPGDLVNVKSGYGRNFLIPTGKAVRADEENKAEYEKRKEALMTAEADRKGAAKKQSEAMEGLSIEISASVSEEGTLYGSIGTREIADALTEKGFEIEKSAVRLPEGALKELGEYSLDIELHPEVIQSVLVQITALEDN
jgi:large subunit ribosomal protein L9|tara:strand:+ start:723 stop:1178 length:456 start_codon:yes stop_codon:yes gene_type:complete